MARIHTFLVSCWPYFRIYNIKCPRNEWHFQKDLYQIETSVKQRPSCHLFLCGCELILYVVRVMSQTAFHLDREKKNNTIIEQKKWKRFWGVFFFIRKMMIIEPSFVYETNQPKQFTMAHILLIFFLSLNFCFFGKLCTKQQKQVLFRIRSSLFWLVMVWLRN